MGFERSESSSATTSSSRLLRQAEPKSGRRNSETKKISVASDNNNNDNTTTTTATPTATPTGYCVNCDPSSSHLGVDVDIGVNGDIGVDADLDFERLELDDFDFDLFDLAPEIGGEIESRQSSNHTHSEDAGIVEIGWMLGEEVVAELLETLDLEGQRQGESRGENLDQFLEVGFDLGPTAPVPVLVTSPSTPRSTSSPGFLQTLEVGGHFAYSLPRPFPGILSPLTSTSTFTPISHDSVTPAENGVAVTGFQFQSWNGNNLFTSGSGVSNGSYQPVPVQPEPEENCSLPTFSDLLPVHIPQTTTVSGLEFLNLLNTPPPPAPPRRKPRQERPTNPNVLLSEIVVEGVPIPSKVWAKAFIEVGAKKKGVTKAGNALFDKLFSNEEVLTSTKSGRLETDTLDPTRLKAIKVAVTWMHNNRRNSQNPYNFRLEDVGTLTEEEDAVLEKVPVDRGNERRRKLKNKGRGRRDSSNPEPEPGLSLSPGESNSGSSYPPEIRNILHTLGPSPKKGRDDEEDDAASTSKRARM